MTSTTTTPALTVPDAECYLRFTTLLFVKGTEETHCHEELPCSLPCYFGTHLRPNTRASHSTALHNGRLCPVSREVCATGRADSLKIASQHNPEGRGPDAAVATSDGGLCGTAVRVKLW